jgi:phosphoribosylformylglycinamidine synthase subunit PurQ / glutaminase
MPGVGSIRLLNSLRFLSPSKTAMTQPRALVLRAPGTNCDEEAAWALSRAGALAETWHINQVIESPVALDRFQILTIPGGFSYGDDLGAGRILATRIATTLSEALRRFHDRGGLVLGICNGFQVLVRAGLLPGGSSGSTTLAANESGRFEDRWVTLLPRPGLSPFVTFTEPIELPVAHGEGRFLMSDPAGVNALESAGQVVFQYGGLDSRPTQDYPANPNGSAQAVAGVCDPTGRIFGLMPHPERFIEPWHHPRWTRRRNGSLPQGAGLQIFESAVRAF